MKPALFRASLLPYNVKWYDLRGSSFWFITESKSVSGRFLPLIHSLLFLLVICTDLSQKFKRLQEVIIYCDRSVNYRCDNFIRIFNLMIVCVFLSWRISVMYVYSTMFYFAPMRLAFWSTPCCSVSFCYTMYTRLFNEYSHAEIKQMFDFICLLLLYVVKFAVWVSIFYLRWIRSRTVS
jgi:hypothetical protein